MTPLEEIILAAIRAEGPMRLDRYMALCLGHPQYGYYTSRDPFGAAGDFVTAPEISQMFGELIGVWAVGAWQAMGEPACLGIVELGPGRGTLMADLLRAARVAPAFLAAASVHLVETSLVLRGRQRQALPYPAAWHESLATVPDGPFILIANEFFDALPARQFQFAGGRWRERVIGIDGGGLCFGLADHGLPPPAIAKGAEGDIIELSAARQAIATEAGRRLARHPGAALIIDYGHLATSPGDTLQAVHRHRHVPVTFRPGESDLTSHVDFEALAAGIEAGGGKALTPLTQGTFLERMGLAARAATLAARADEAVAARIASEARRLAHEDEMGNLFKVLAAASPELPGLYPFTP